MITFRYCDGAFEPWSTYEHDVDWHVVGLHDSVHLCAGVTVQNRFGRRRVWKQAEQRWTRDQWICKCGGKIL